MFEGFQTASSGLLRTFLTNGDGGALIVGIIVFEQQVGDGEGGEVSHSLIKH